jgi:hypothetical protein
MAGAHAARGESRWGLRTLVPLKQGQFVLCVAGQVKRLVTPTAQRHEHHVLVHRVADWLPPQVQQDALEEEFDQLEDDEPVVKVTLATVSCSHCTLDVISYVSSRCCVITGPIQLCCAATRCF